MATFLKLYNGSYAEVLDECTNASNHEIMIRYRDLFGGDKIYVFPKRQMSQEIMYHDEYRTRYEIIETDLTVEEFRQQILKEKEEAKEEIKPQPDLENEEEAYEFDTYEPTKKWMLITYLPMLLLIPIFYLQYEYKYTHQYETLQYTLCTIYAWLQMIVYGLCFHYYADINEKGFIEKKMTQKMVRRYNLRMYLGRALVVLHGFSLIIGYFLLICEANFISYFSTMFPILVMFVIGVVFFACYNPLDWESAKEWAESNKIRDPRPTSNTQGSRYVGSGIPYTSYTPAHTESTPTASTTSSHGTTRGNTRTTHTTHNTSHTNPNAPWEHFNREQDRYHNWACGHDDPYDCDHDDCY